MDKIVIAVDLSDDYPSYEAVRERIKSDTQISLLNVIDDWEIPEIIRRQLPDPKAVQTYTEQLVKDACAKLDSVAATHFADYQVTTHALLAEQAVAKEIADFSYSRSANLLVLCNRTHGLFESIFNEAVTSGVLAKTNIPILILPKQE